MSSVSYAAAPSGDFEEATIQQAELLKNAWQAPNMETGSSVSKRWILAMGSLGNIAAREMRRPGLSRRVPGLRRWRKCGSHCRLDSPRERVLGGGDPRTPHLSYRHTHPSSTRVQHRASLSTGRFARIPSRAQPFQGMSLPGPNRTRGRSPPPSSAEIENSRAVTPSAAPWCTAGAACRYARAYEPSKILRGALTLTLTLTRRVLGGENARKHEET